MSEFWNGFEMEPVSFKGQDACVVFPREGTANGRLALKTVYWGAFPNAVEAGSPGNLGEFGWGGAAGATVLADPQIGLSVFYAHHMLDPQERYYQPRLRNVVYSCL